MGQTYNYHQREPHNSWVMAHIDLLLSEAEKHQNVSFVLYSALEARNLLEKTEFDIMLMSVDQSEWQKLSEMARGKYGLTKSNNHYKVLKYKYQTFSEAFVKVVLDFELRVFNYRESEKIQSQLSEYIHIYTRTPQEMEFNSEFIQSGIKQIKSALSFIKDYYVIHDKQYKFGVLNFGSLTGPMKDEFEEWKISVSEDTDELFLRLKEINEKEFKGAKAKKIE